MLAENGRDLARAGEWLGISVEKAKRTIRLQSNAFAKPPTRLLLAKTGPGGRASQ